MRFSLLFNLTGTVLLYLSFQATSSTVKIVSAPNGASALCMGSMALFEGKGGSFVIGTGCPDWPNAKPIALVTVEKPLLIYVGFGLLTFGFLMQLLSKPSEKSLAQMRAELKAARKLEKHKNHPTQSK
jgi:hypothetical protein